MNTLHFVRCQFCRNEHFKRLSFGWLDCENPLIRKNKGPILETKLDDEKKCSKVRNIHIIFFFSKVVLIIEIYGTPRGNRNNWSFVSKRHSKNKQDKN